jgi:hypothetical protein
LSPCFTFFPPLKPRKTRKSTKGAKRENFYFVVFRG